MKKLTLVFAVAVLLALSGAPSVVVAGDFDMKVTNKTGHEVTVFMFEDDDVHLDEHGGVEFAHLRNGESAVAHVSTCKFSVLLVDHDDVWHAEFHDCKANQITFTSNTGHGKHGH